MTVKTEFLVYWIVTLCCVVTGYQRFEGLCCFYLQGWTSSSRSSETLAPNHHTTRRNNPEYPRIQVHHLYMFRVKPCRKSRTIVKPVTTLRYTSMVHTQRYFLDSRAFGSRHRGRLFWLRYLVVFFSSYKCSGSTPTYLTTTSFQVEVKLSQCLT